MKLTKAQFEALRILSRIDTWTAYGPNKAMCNKLVKKGAAYVRPGTPLGYSITDAGRAAPQGKGGE